MAGRPRGRTPGHMTLPVFFLISLLVAGGALYVVARRRRDAAEADQVRDC